MKLSVFAVDEDKSENGVWHEIGEGAKILVAKAGNENFRKLVRKLTKPYDRRVRAKDKTVNTIISSLVLKAIAQTILLDWSGFEDEDGDDLKYSPEVAEEMLEKYPRFARIIDDLAMDESIYQMESENEVVKKQNPSSKTEKS